MNDVIEEAYNGQLSYNQYVMFIVNVKLAREYGLEINSVDWDRVWKAIVKKINTDFDNLEEPESDHHREVIGDLSNYTEDEKKTYAIIADMRDHETIILEKNRRQFISIMKNDPDAALALQQNKRFRCFDSEMAEATLEGYKQAENIVKAKFPNAFYDTWRNYKHSFDAKKEDIEEFEKAFTVLKDGLTELIDYYKNEPFRKRFTEAFVEKIDLLLRDDEYEADKT